MKLLTKPPFSYSWVLIFSKFVLSVNIESRFDLNLQGKERTTETEEIIKSYFLVSF